MSTKKTRAEFDADDVVDVYFCGSIRCYVQGGDNRQARIALVETTGTIANPKPVVRVFSGPRGETRELAAEAMSELLESPGNFPLHGMHWVSGVSEGPGAVLTEEPPTGGGQRDWPSVLAQDARALAKTRTWARAKA